MDLHDGALVAGRTAKGTYATTPGTKAQQVNESSSCGSLGLRETSSGGALGIDELSLSGMSDDGNAGNNADSDGIGDMSREKRGGRRHEREYNQREDDDDDEAASRSWSSLSVAASDLSLEQMAGDGESLALSVSTESDAGPEERVLYSSQSQASEPEDDEDGDARSRVVLLDAAQELEEQELHQDDAMNASSLSGEMSSSSFEVQYVEEHDDEELETHGDEEDDDDDLWRAFDAAVHIGEELARYSTTSRKSPLVSTRNLAIDRVMAPPSAEDEGYDGSESEAESVSSLGGDSVGDPSTDEFFYAGVHADGNREAVLTLLRDDSGVDSMGSSPRERRPASPISSLASSEPWAHGANQSADSLSSIGADEADDRQWIENVPMLPQPIDPLVGETNEFADGIESAPFWRESEYVEARTGRSRSRRRRMWTDSDESLVLGGEDAGDQRDSPWEEGEFNALPTLLPTKTTARIPYEDVQVEESYVAYADLMGIIETHVPRRPGLLLDLGCGTSRVCEELVYHGYKRVVGVDKDLSAIAFQRHQAAAVQLHTYLQFWPMDAASALLLPDQSCDFILSKATLDAIAARGIRDAFPSELVETLKETIRCLKPGGILMAMVYQANLLDEDGGERTRTKGERVAARLTRPWWRWGEVSGLLHRQLTLVRQYALGCPRVVDGVRTTPYKVLVWRRKETDKHRLQRLLGELVEGKRQQHEYDTRIWFYRTEHELELREAAMIREARQMILEDERSWLERAFAHEPVAVQERQQRRRAFYAALLDEERRQMVWEDDAGTRRRALEQAMKAFVVDTILRDLAIGQAVDRVIAKQVEAERKKQEAAALNTAIETKRLQALADAQLQVAATVAWIREEAVRIVNAAVASLEGGGDLPEPVPGLNSHNGTKNPALLTEPTPASQTGGLVRDAGESHAVLTAAAAETVSRILSMALSSVTTGDDSPKKPIHAMIDRAGVDTADTETSSANLEADDAESKAKVVAETVAWILSAAMACLKSDNAPRNQEMPGEIDTADLKMDGEAAMTGVAYGIANIEAESSSPSELRSTTSRSGNLMEPSDWQTSTEASSRNVGPKDALTTVHGGVKIVEQAPGGRPEDTIAEACAETLETILGLLQ